MPLLWVEALGFKVQGLGCKIDGMGLGFRVRFKVYKGLGYGFSVKAESSRLRVCISERGVAFRA